MFYEFGSIRQSALFLLTKIEKIAGKSAVENGMENYGCNYS